MVGFASELWVASPDSAMTIFATMPSGAPGIHRAREGISLLTFGDGWLATSSSSSPPTLSSCSTSTSPLATDCTYIGTSTSTLRATQWLNPFIPLHAALSLETTCVPSWFGTAQPPEPTKARPAAQPPEPAKARPADFGSEPGKARSGSEPARQGPPHQRRNLFLARKRLLSFCSTGRAYRREQTSSRIGHLGYDSPALHITMVRQG